MKKIAELIDWMLTFNGFAMIATATLQIISRMMNRPVAWTVELLTFFGLFSIIPGVVSHFLKGSETRVGIIVDYLPARIRQFVEFIINGICATFGLSLLYATYDYTALVGMSNPDQYLPFPPETNLLPVYLLSFAIIWNSLNNLCHIITDRSQKHSTASEGGKQ